MGNKDLGLATNNIFYFLAIVQSIALDSLIYTSVLVFIIEIKKAGLNNYSLLKSLPAKKQL